MKHQKAQRIQEKNQKELLNIMDTIIPWEEWVYYAKLYYSYSESLRKQPQTIEILLRMLMIQSWFDLTDETMEDVLLHSDSMMNFLKLKLYSQPFPNCFLFSAFRKRMLICGLYTIMLRSIEVTIEKSGKIIQNGMLIDISKRRLPPSNQNKLFFLFSSIRNKLGGKDWYIDIRCHIEPYSGIHKTGNIDVSSHRTLEFNKPCKRHPKKQTHSRTEYVTKNILWGYVGNITSMVMSFISRTIFIYAIGVTYLGVNGLFTNVLGVLSFTELGIGTAMNFSLYKPVAKRDIEKIKALLYVYKMAYRVIALVVTILGLALIPALPYIIKGGENIEHIPVYYLIFLFNSVSSYFVTYQYGLIYAEQKGYILTNINSISRFVILLFQTLVLIIFKNFLGYLLTQAVIQLIQKIVTAWYIHKRYTYLSDKNIQKLNVEDKRMINTNVKALIVHKLGEISVYQTDNIIISAFISVTLVGLVSNYTMLITTVSGFLVIIFNSFTAGFGNLIATETKEIQKKLFNVYHFLGFWLYGVSTISFVILIQPFICLWLGRDKMIDNLSMGLILANQYFVGQRMTMNNFKTAGGVFNPDKYISIIQSVVNLVLSITLVFIIGLPGIYIGTVVQGLISNILRPIIVYRVMFEDSAVSYFKDCFKYLCSTIGTVMVMLVISKMIMTTTTLKPFVLMVLLTAIIPNAIFYILFRKDESFVFLSDKLKSLLKGRMRIAK